jgi:hypothetical protein
MKGIKGKWPPFVVARGTLVNVTREIEKLTEIAGNATGASEYQVRLVLSQFAANDWVGRLGEVQDIVYGEGSALKHLS